MLPGGGRIVTIPWASVSDLVRERSEGEREAKRSSFPTTDVEKQPISGPSPFHSSLGMRSASAGICLRVSCEMLTPVTNTV